MTKVIACRDSGWIDLKTDYGQWSHACRAFGAELQLVDSLDLAEIPSGHTIVVLEEQGEITLDEFIHPEDAVYVFGRSGLNGIQNMIDHDIMVRIKTKKDICLFGITAVGIVLYDREMKNGCNNI